MKDANIAFVDFYDTGHHVSYLSSLSKKIACNIVIGAPGLSILGAKKFNVTISNRKKGPIRIEISRLLAVIRAFVLIYKEKVSHAVFIYSDRFIIYIFFCSLIFKNVNISIIIHWLYFMNEEVDKKNLLKYKLEIYLLRLLSMKGVKIIVHSDVAKNRLSPANINSVSVNYPISNISSAIKDVHSDLEKETIKILFFGGTRFDKGVDILIAALGRLGENFHLNVVGKEEDFNRELLTELAEKYKVSHRVNFDLRFVKDEEIPDIFLNSDLLVLPYRKCFSGQSGPLTIAISCGLKVVAPNLDIIEETVLKYNAGRVYMAEDIEGMVRAVRLESETQRYIDIRRFLNDHDEDGFSARVAQIILYEK